MLGRDPAQQPLTPLEAELFYRATLEHVEKEFEVPAIPLVTRNVGD